MKSATVQKLIEHVDRMDVAESVKRQVKQLIREVCAPDGIEIRGPKERVYYARRLLDEGLSRPTIRDRLMVRDRISRRQAYRIIDEALKLCQKMTPNGTEYR